MSVDSVLDSAFTTLLAKAQRRAFEQAQPPMVLPTALTMLMDGIGQPLTVGHAGSMPVPFPCLLLGCQMRAGMFNATLGPEPVVATATVELRLGMQGAWASGTQPLYGSAPPSMTAVAEATPSITGWVTELEPTDMIAFALTAFSGTATFLEVSLIVRRLDVRGLGVSVLTDSGGDEFTDGSGEPFVVRG